MFARFFLITSTTSWGQIKSELPETTSIDIPADADTLGEPSRPGGSMLLLMCSLSSRERGLWSPSYTCFSSRLVLLYLGCRFRSVTFGEDGNRLLMMGTICRWPVHYCETPELVWFTCLDNLEGDSGKIQEKKNSDSFEILSLLNRFVSNLNPKGRQFHPVCHNPPCLTC